MKVSTRIVRALAGTAVLAMAAPVLAQAGPPPAPAERPDISKPMADPPRSTVYEAVTGLPAISGTWYPDFRAAFGAGRPRPQLTPAAQAKLDAYNAKYKEGGPPLYAQSVCRPPGMPGMMQQPYPIDITLQPGRVTLYAEAYEQTRWIYTDGTKLPADPDPFFNGTSVGHWDGNVLAIDTVGFSPLTTIGPGIEHSDQMKIHERIYLVTPKLLVDEMTITDPEVLAEPYVIHLAFKPDTVPLREYVCAENNRLEAGEGGANINLDLNGGGADDPFGPPVEDKSGSKSDGGK